MLNIQEYWLPLLYRKQSIFCMVPIANTPRYLTFHHTMLIRAPQFLLIQSLVFALNANNDVIQQTYFRCKGLMVLYFVVLVGYENLNVGDSLFTNTLSQNYPNCSINDEQNVIFSTVLHFFYFPKSSPHPHDSKWSTAKYRSGLSILRILFHVQSKLTNLA